MISKSEDARTPEEIELSKLSKNELFEEERKQRHIAFAPNKNLSGREARIIRPEAERKLKIITRLLQQIELDEKQAHANADSSYIQKAIPENLMDIRYCIEPSRTLNMPMGATIETLNWQKPVNTKITWQAPKQVRENGTRITKLETYEFDLLSIKADALKELLAKRFNNRLFQVKNQTILIIYV